MDLELLKEIGLTDSEIKVYLALLELGSSSKGPIVDKSSVASSKIYELLEKLMQKGLVSTIIKSNVKHFEAAPPKRLLDYMNERKKDLEEKEKKLSDLIPQLEVKRSLAGIESETQVFKGMKGATTAFDDILNTLSLGDELLVSGFSDTQEYFQNFLIRFHNKRSKKGIKLRAVFGKSLENMNEKLNSMPYSNVKTVYTTDERPVATLIYKDKVLFSLPKDNLWIQIKNLRLANSYRSEFESLWNQETYIVKGIDALQEFFEEMLEAGHCDFLGARGYFMDQRPDYILNWGKRAKKMGFTMRNIVDLKVKGHTITNFKFVETKYTLDKTFIDLSVYWIYGNKVVISNWAGDEPIAMVIENKLIVDMYKKQFELLWDK